MRVGAMSLKQMAILIVAVVGLVVIATLSKVGLGGRGSPDVVKEDIKPVVAGAPHLTFANAVEKGGTIVVPGPPSPLDPTRPPEREAMLDGHNDYWFVNENDNPVELFVTHLSCNICLSVKAALAPKGLLPAQAATAVAAGPAGALGGVPQAATQVPVPGEDVKWEAVESEEMKRGARSFQVPAKAAGWVRMCWKDEQPDRKLLSIDLRTTSPAGSAPPIRLEMGAIFVEAVRVLPPNKEINVGVLRTGNQSRTGSFLVCSSTRDHITLEPESDDVQKREHPFVTCGKPVPLTDDERHALEAEHKAVILCGYKVPVTVRERLDDGREHDLGPFHSPIALTSDARNDPLALTVVGEVKGDVNVVAGDGIKDRVAFDVFPRSRGATKTVAVEADPGTELTFDRAPNFLKVELAPQESSGRVRKAWTLTVTIPPNAVSGRFPRPDDPDLGDTAIYLKSKARGVRIPVSGTAANQ
jgi:hypothetical protein